MFYTVAVIKKSNASTSGTFMLDLNRLVEIPPGGESPDNALTKLY